MNKKILENAIENIGDKYINEFADIKPAKKRSYSFFKIASIAACVALIAVGSLALVNNLGSPAPEIPPVVATQTGESEGSNQDLLNSTAVSDSAETSATISESSPDISQNIPDETSAETSVDTSVTPPEESADTSYGEGETIWGSSFVLAETPDSQPAEKGKIIISHSLKSAMEESENPNDLFAVYISEHSDASKKDIYNNFVKPLNAEKEDYMKTNIVFLSEKQILQAKGNEAFAIVFALARKETFPPTIVTEENIDSLPDNMVMCATVKFKQKHTEESFKQFLEKYNLPEGDSYLSIASPNRCMLLIDKEAVRRIMSDELVEEIECSEIVELGL